MKTHWTRPAWVFVVSVLAALAAAGGVYAGSLQHQQPSRAQPSHQQARHAKPRNEQPRAGQSVQEAWVVGGASVWAWTQDMNGPYRGGGAQGIELTTNGGSRWSDVTPSGLAIQGGKHWISGLFALNSRDAWVTYGGLSGGSTQTILSSTDGGARWTVVGTKPHGNACSLQFVSRDVGWCTAIGAAAGSEGVTLYGTTDGGHRWRLLSRTGLDSNTGPGVLQFNGDKNIEFTDVHTGWAGYETAVGTAPLFESTDGGRTWVQRHVADAPGTVEGGGFVGQPVLVGRAGAVGYSVEGRFGAIKRRVNARTIVYVTSDGGVAWHPVIPPGPAEPWLVDAMTPLRWRLVHGKRILLTDDAGKTWRTITASHAFGPLSYAYGSPTAPVVNFSSDNAGWVVQDDPAGSTSILWRTADGGRHWTRIRIPGT